MKQQYRHFYEALRITNYRHNDGRFLGYIQQQLDMILGCRTAYAGSIALFVNGEVDRFGDIDVVTERLFSPEELPFKVDQISRFGLKNDKLNLDILFMDRPENIPMLQLANKHITEVEGIRIQEPNFVKQINWFWRGGKERLMIPSDNRELEAALK